MAPARRRVSAVNPCTASPRSIAAPAPVPAPPAQSASSHPQQPSAGSALDRSPERKSSPSKPVLLDLHPEHSEYPSSLRRYNPSTSSLSSTKRSRAESFSAPITSASSSSRSSKRRKAISAPSSSPNKTSYNLRPRDKGKHRDAVPMSRSNSTRSRPVASTSTSTSTPGPSGSNPHGPESQSAHDMDVDVADLDINESIDESSVIDDHDVIDDDHHPIDIEPDGADDDDDEDIEDELDIEDGVFDDEMHDPLDDVHGFSTFRASFGGQGSQQNHLRTLMSQARSSTKPLARTTYLQEVAEVLSTATEDDLGSSFDATGICKDLVAILSDPGDDTDWEDSQGQILLLASRCLNNLMEALHGSSSAVVYAGAVPLLCSKLVEIQYIDLAEQNLITLRKISMELPSSIVKENGLHAVLQFLDFFPIHSQRTAVTTAANCCKALSSDAYPMVLDIMPILRNVLASTDDRVLEQGCLAVTRIVECYRQHPDKLAVLLSSETLSPLVALLIPGGSGPSVNPTIYAQILRVFSIGAKACPEVAINLVEMDVANTLFHVLNGIAPPVAEDLETLTTKLHNEDDLAVLQNLVHRPKDQVQETLLLVSEILPALPKTGILDPKAFITRSARSSGRAKSSQRNIEDAGQMESSSSITPADADATKQLLSDTRTDEPTLNNREPGEMTAPERHAFFFTNDNSPKRVAAVNRFHALMLPTLIDVYLASISLHIRSRVVSALLKIVNFCKPDILMKITEDIPVAAFLASMLSSRDQPSLVTGALQLVELLTSKIPDTYTVIFRKEGVSGELHKLAEAPLQMPNSSSKKQALSQSSGGSSSTVSKAEVSTLASALRNPPSTTPGALQNSPTFANFSSSKGQSSLPDALIQDAITKRAKHVYQTLKRAENDVPNSALQELESVRGLAARFQSAVKDSTSAKEEEKKVKEALQELIKRLEAPDVLISSFEFLESGLVDALLDFSSGVGSRLSSLQRRRLMVECLIIESCETALGSSQALSLLVKKLQESLGRHEEFDIVTAMGSAGDDKKSPASLFTRQLKLRLQPEGIEAPRSIMNGLISIAAIGTFQAIHDILFPRIAATASRSDSPAGSNLVGTSSSTIGESSRRLPESASAGSSSRKSNMKDLAEGEQSSRTRRSSRLSKGDGEGEEDKDDASDDYETLAGAARDVSMPSIPRHETDNASASTPGRSNEHIVKVAATDEGDEMEASTPHGTRIGTPLGKQRSQPQDTGSSGNATPRKSGSSKSPSKQSSYAAALRTDSKDFHLVFSMGGVDIPLDTTIYSAVHDYENRMSGNQNDIWSSLYTVKFRKVEGPAPPINERKSTSLQERDSKTASDLTSGDSVTSKLLRLLRVFYELNSDWAEIYGSNAISDPMISDRTLPENMFINNKLTAKLNRQLDESMIIASSCLPIWALTLPQSFRFLFPLETRFSFLQSTSFGYARLMQKWIEQSRNTRIDDSIRFLGTLERQKVRISRDRLIESTMKIFQLYGSSRAILEIEYFDEVGTGLGPTLEFYAMVSKEIVRREFGLWREGDTENSTPYIFNPCGLFPAPIDQNALQTSSAQKRLSLFKLLGQFVARSLFDGRIIDIPFGKTFMKLALKQEVPLTIESVRSVDKSLARSLEFLQRFAALQFDIENDGSLSESEKEEMLDSATVDGTNILELALDFTVPGFDIELIPDGRAQAVTMSNVNEYIELVIQFTLVKGTKAQLKAFREGFSNVFPVQDLQAFSPEELVSLLGHAIEDWSFETLINCVKADHGYTLDSQIVKSFLTLLSEYTSEERREMLQFLTGSPRLPIGGFRGLHPPLTIVRRPVEGSQKADDYLPSVMTCVNFLKLPDYGSIEKLRERFHTAIQEGKGSFHFS